MKGFSEKERKQIRKDLIETGFELFSQYGLEKTTIKDITDKVDIAKGSFYNFFNSKEELYLEIITKEMKKTAKKLMKETEKIDDGEKMIKTLLNSLFQELEKNPLYKKAVMEDATQKIYRKLPEEKINKKQRETLKIVRPQIKKWQKQGKIKKRDPEIIHSFFKSLSFIKEHEKQIGEEIYPQVQELLIETIAKGITKTTNTQKTTNNKNQKKKTNN